MIPAPDLDPWEGDARSRFPSPEEVAYAEELIRLDALDRATWGEDEPTPDVSVLSDAELLEAMTPVPAAVDLMLLDSIDPLALPDRHAVLDYLKAADRVLAFTTSLAARARVALAGVSASPSLQDEVHLEAELAIATRSSRFVAGVGIEQARVLHSSFPSFLAALRAGEVSPAHCATLVRQTRPVSGAAVLARIEQVTLPKAKRLTPGAFAAAVAKAIATHDPDARGRMVRAREQRAVWTRQGEDGMSYLGMVHDTSTIRAIKARIDAAAAALCEDRGGRTALLDGEEDAAMPACRADALAALILGNTGEDGGVSWVPEPDRVQVQLVIDLQTLRGEAERACLLDGQPIPASVGRELAGYAQAFRRMVTDPVTGHLLDYGRQTYLPAPLRTYVMARDGGCRAPGCGVKDPRRLQLDHAVEYPDGPSDTANTGCLCVPHHQQKTARLARIENSASDGSCDWITAWGQKIHIPPRAFLHDPTDDPPDPDPPPLEEPPF